MATDRSPANRLDPNTNRPNLAGVPPAFVAKARHDYPNLSDAEIKSDWFDLAMNQKETARRYMSMPDPSKTPGQGIFNTIRDAATAAVRKPFELAGRLDTALGIKTPEQAQSRADTYAKAIVPQTPAGAVVAALPAVGPVARALGVAAPILRAAPILGRAGAVGGLARAGVAGAAGAAANEAGGESPTIGAVQGTLGSAVPEAVGSVSNWVASQFQKGTTAAQLYAEVHLPAAKRFLDAMQKDVPALYARIKPAIDQGAAALMKRFPEFTEDEAVARATPPALASIQDKAVFQAVKTPMDQAEAQIVKEVPKIPNPIAPAPKPGAPAAGAGAWGSAGMFQKIYDDASPANQAAMRARYPNLNFGGGKPETEMIDTSKAIQLWRQAAEDARSAYKAGNAVEGRMLADKAQQLEDAITENASPAARGAWQAARAEYGNALRYQELQQGARIGAESAGTPFNPTGVEAEIRKDPGRYSESELPGLAEHYWGEGVQPGTVPTVTNPRMSLPIPGAAARGTFSLGQRVTNPGQAYGAPAVADALAAAARSGLINLGRLGIVHPGPEAPRASGSDVYINVGGGNPTGELGVAPGDTSDPLPLAERYLQSIGRFGGQHVGEGEAEQ